MVWGGVVSVIRAGVESLEEKSGNAPRESHDVLSRSYQGGLGVGSSALALQAAGALGIDAGAVPHENNFIQSLRARAIYGVSMGEDGVSQVLSLKLEQATANARE